MLSAILSSGDRQLATGNLTLSERENEMELFEIGSASLDPIPPKETQGRLP
jgi:hypothetical protein